MYLTAKLRLNLVHLKIENFMKITSSVFEHQGKIPAKYTCIGEDVSPPLQFEDVPSEAKSLVLIVDDPDAPVAHSAGSGSSTWVHWVVFNMPPTVKGIGENSVPEGGIEGDTSFGKPGYGGPCPPSGEHRYFFKLYALSEMLTFEHLEKMDKQSVEEKMKDKILDQAELLGLFSK
jgi:Raf kinase inhibitor-like YbhB/YbcL family protein